MDWSTLFATLIGALAALAGGALAPVLSARSEHKTWQRDKLEEVCEEFNGVLSEALEKYPHVVEALDASDFPLFEERFERMRAIASRAELYVSDDLRYLMQEAWAIYRFSYREAFNDKGTRDTRAEAYTSFYTAAQSALNQMRADLGLKPLREDEHFRPELSGRLRRKLAG